MSIYFKGMFAFGEIHEITVNNEKNLKELTAEYDHVNPNINDRNFKIRKKNWGHKNIIIISSFSDMKASFVLEKAREFRLKRPTYEDALFFGEEVFKHIPLSKRELMFLHKPLAINARRKVITFLRGKMGLDIYLKDIDEKIYGPTTFAFLV